VSFLRFTGITRRFPGVVALDDVSLSVEEGSCHALMGENGAGKSTLGKILAGVYTADAGEIQLEGKLIHPTTPLAARHLGIAMVHQELAFCPNLTVAENLCLGDLPARAGWVDRGRMRERARLMLVDIGADIDVDRPIGELSTGHEQVVQIAAAIGTGARVIVFDEPTSSLSASESEHLFALIAILRRRGITMIYVSHRMEEVFRLCDTVSVLRDGRHVATQPASGMTRDQLVEQMVGRKVSALKPRHLEQEPGKELLRVENLCSPGRFKDVSFVLREGEVMGFAGLIGAGRSEVAQAIFGLDPRATGSVYVSGRRIGPGRVNEALAAGLGLLPEDRKRQGLVLSMNCRENASLAALPRLTRWGFVRPGLERSVVTQFTDRLRVKTPSLETTIASLSGGNQQKVALAKWLAQKCRILIVDEPTRGVDVGAKAEIHALLDELACQGYAILMISSELPEVMSLSRRILVFREGRVVGEVAHANCTQGGLLRLMAGVERETVT
jgi:ABC-type sugar transport system ATPase subunit